jgi:hypothetical protein
MNREFVFSDVNVVYGKKRGRSGIKNNRVFPPVPDCALNDDPTLSAVRRMILYSAGCVIGEIFSYPPAIIPVAGADFFVYFRLVSNVRYVNSLVKTMPFHYHSPIRLNRASGKKKEHQHCAKSGQPRWLRFFVRIQNHLSPKAVENVYSNPPCCVVSCVLQQKRPTITAKGS